MTFKEFGENAEIEYTCYVTVNGETAGEISGYSEESLLEQLRKLDTGIKNELESQWNDLPENQESEDEE